MPEKITETVDRDHYRKVAFSVIFMSRRVNGEIDEIGMYYLLRNGFLKMIKDLSPLLSESLKLAWVFGSTSVNSL